MGKSIGVNAFLAKKYKTLALSEQWAKHLGEPEHNFKMLIWGQSSSGKTTLCVTLAKMLSQFGKVYYNSSEEGDSKSLQDSILRCGLADCKGSIVFGNRDTYEEMKAKLKRNRAKFVFIDSVQYMKLTIDQYKELCETYKHKSFIVVSWSEGKEPKGATAKAMKYRVCIKVFVSDGVAQIFSRFGKTIPYKIFDRPVTPGQTIKMNLDQPVEEPVIEMVKCECGKEAPLDSSWIDTGGCWHCPECIASQLEEKKGETVTVQETVTTQN